MQTPRKLAAAASLDGVSITECPRERSFNVLVNGSKPRVMCHIYALGGGGGGGGVWGRHIAVGLP